MDTKELPMVRSPLNRPPIIGGRALRSEVELRAFAARVAREEQRRLGFDHGERREYRKYVEDCLSRLSRGLGHPAPPESWFRERALARERGECATAGAVCARVWDEGLAVSVLRELEALWVRVGYKLAPTLLWHFIEETRTTLDLSHYLPALRASPIYAVPLAAHVRELAAAVDFRHGRHDLPATEWGDFRTSWLPVVSANPLSYLNAGDFSYAARRPAFSYDRATLTIGRSIGLDSEGSRHFVPQVLVTFAASNMTLRDCFGFEDEAGRRTSRGRSSDYALAGTFLQHELPQANRYRGVDWSMRWAEHSTWLVNAG